MEPKKEQIVRKMLDKVHAFVQKWWPLAILFCTIVLWLTVVALILTSCSSQKYVTEQNTQRTTRDSVIYTYKTLLRDSIRIKDSVRIMTKTKVRDSVVLRIDNATGNVISREAWHTTDTNTDRDHVADVGKMVSKADSVAREHVKADSVATNKVMDKKAAETNKTKKNDGKPWRRLLRSYVAGLLTGGILFLLWKYRRKILQVLKLLIKIVH